MTKDGRVKILDFGLAKLKPQKLSGWASAEREIKRGIELNPGYLVGHRFYAIYLATIQERFDDAIAEAQLAMELDPLSLPLHNIVALLLLDARRYDEAIAVWRKMLDIDPKAAGAYNEIGWAYEIQGQYDMAAEADLQAMVVAGEQEAQVEALRQCYAAEWIKAIRAMKLQFFLQK